MSYLDELTAIWESVKLSLKEKYAPSFVNLWFEDLKISSYEDNIITLSTVSEFKFDLLKKKHLPIIKEGFSEFLGFEPEVEILFVGVPTSPEKILNQMRDQDGLYSSSNSGSDPAPASVSSASDAAPKKSATIPSGAIPQNYKF